MSGHWFIERAFWRDKSLNLIVEAYCWSEAAETPYKHTEGSKEAQEINRKALGAWL